MSDPHLRMAEIKLPGPLVLDPENVTGFASNTLLEDIVNGKLTFIVVLTFSGTRGRMWQLRDTPAPDDFVRAIAKREGATALAVCARTPLPPEVDADRAYTISAETPQGRADLIVGLKGGRPPGGEQFRLFKRRHSDPTCRWLGVEPVGEVTLWEEGPVGPAGPKGEA